MNSRPEAISERIYILSCFLFALPAATVEATKHRGGLARIIFLGRPPSTDLTRQPAEVTPRIQHTGDVEGDVAALSCQC